MRAGWALQQAKGLTSGLENDSTITSDAARTEYPLAFDRRHSGDLSLFVGRASGTTVPWSAALTTTVQSGYPIFRPGIGNPLSRDDYSYLPWTANVDLRASWDFGSLPVCTHCAWRLVFDGRNIINKKNILALRSSSGSIAPTLGEVQNAANALPLPSESIPRESSMYSALADANHDGVMTPAEAANARFAAALDRYDPTLFFGEGRQIRLGVEVTF